MFLLFIPEIILCVSIFLFLCLLVGKKETSEHTAFNLALGTGVLFLASAVASFGNSGVLFSGSYKADLLSQGFKAIIAIGFIFTTILSKQSESICKKRLGEYFLFLTTGTLGMTMIPSAIDLLTLFVSLELSAYSLYLLAALRQNSRTPEASVKYLVFGAAVSGISLWGLSLIVGMAGSSSLAVIGANAATLAENPVFIVGVLLFSLSLLFKLSNFPMHFWAPDIYESASTPVTAFIATASKASAVAVLIRVLFWVGVPAHISSIFGVLAFISMTLGNTAALVQKDVKRLLAYSSIAQAGYIILGLMAGTPEAFSSAYFYAFAYVVMNSGAFLVVALVARHIQNDNPKISDFDGLAEKAPFLSLILLLSLLSLAGIPPLVGFTGKWVLFTAAMEKGHGFLVLWAVLNSVVSLFYYLTLVKHAYLNKPQTQKEFIFPVHLKVIGFMIFAVLIVAGFFPGPFISFAAGAIQTAGLV